MPTCAHIIILNIIFLMLIICTDHKLNSMKQNITDTTFIRSVRPMTNLMNYVWNKRWCHVFRWVTDPRVIQFYKVWLHFPCRGQIVHGRLPVSSFNLDASHSESDQRLMLILMLNCSGQTVTHFFQLFNKTIHFTHSHGLLNKMAAKVAVLDWRK